MPFIQVMDSLVKINCLQKNAKRTELFLLDLIMKLSKKWEIKQLQEILQKSLMFQSVDHILSNQLFNYFLYNKRPYYGHDNFQISGGNLSIILMALNKILKFLSITTKNQTIHGSPQLYLYVQQVLRALSFTREELNSQFQSSFCQSSAD